MSNEQQIEQEIQKKGLNAPRLTPQCIDLEGYLLKNKLFEAVGRE